MLYFFSYDCVLSLIVLHLDNGEHRDSVVFTSSICVLYLCDDWQYCDLVRKNWINVSQNITATMYSGVLLFIIFLKVFAKKKKKKLKGGTSTIDTICILYVITAYMLHVAVCSFFLVSNRLNFLSLSCWCVRFAHASSGFNSVSISRGIWRAVILLYIW